MTTKPPSPKRPAALKIKRILVPLDFSGTSRQALQYAVPLAQQFKARITLLHVIEPAIYPPEFANLAIDPYELGKKATARLQEMAQQFIPQNLRAKPRVRTGSPFHEITSAAESLKADLLILTTHGRTGLTRALLGSTAERVVRHAPCPVLTVRRS